SVDCNTLPTNAMNLIPRTQRGSWINGFLVSTLIACCGWNQTSSDNAGTKSKASETWKYWEAFNKAAVAGTGVEVLPEAKEGDLKAEDLANILRDIAAGEQARCLRIASLPVLFVDSNLT